MKRRGVTLLEIMVVVAIIGVMASLAMYNFEAATRDSKRLAAVREIHSVLMEARGEARARNQPVRVDVVAATLNGTAGWNVRWGVLPCNDAFGRFCPSAACGAGTQCLAGCVCPVQGQAVFVPTFKDGSVTFTGLNGLCFLGSSAAPRGSACDPAAAAVASVRFDLPGVNDPVLILLERLTGSSRVIDCAKVPRDLDCPP